MNETAPPLLTCLTPDDLDAMASRHRAQLVNSLSGVKGLHLLGSRSASGEENLAVFNSVIHIGASPALMGVLFRPLTVRRDSYSNIEETGLFTLNLVSRSMVDQAHWTSAKWPEDQSEFAATGLKPRYSDNFDAPYVGASPIAMGLSLQEIIPVQSNGTVLVIGAVEEIWLPEPVPADGWMRLDTLDIMSVSGLDSYYQPQWVSRKAYAKPHEPPGNLEP